MKLIEFFYRWLIKLQHKIQHISLFFSLIVAEIFIMFADLSFLIAIPEIGQSILTFLIFFHLWKKIKENRKYKMFIRFVNSLIFWNYTFMWVYPFPNIQK